MKKFSGHRGHKEIKQACEEQGLDLNDWHYVHAGWDSIVVQGGGATVYYNTFNGRFHGTTPDGTEFNSSSTEHENEAWFQALLAFFYTE